LSVCYRKAYPPVSNPDDWRTGASSPQCSRAVSSSQSGGSIEAGGIAGSLRLIRSARVPSSSFNAVGLGGLPRMARSLSVASLLTSASQVAGAMDSGSRFGVEGAMLPFRADCRIGVSSPQYPVAVSSSRAASSARCGSPYLRACRPGTSGRWVSASSLAWARSFQR